MINGGHDLPLAHIRVLDFGQYIAGPLAAMMLADQGADVTHIDPLEGQSWDSPMAGILNRRKKCRRLNLKEPGDLAKARCLAAESDILIENFRPGVMARLGLGYQDLKALNPALIYVSLPGFASTDAALAAIPGWEGIVAAATGQFNDMGLNRVLMGINPSFSPLCLPSAYGATLAATSAVAALYAREAGTGGGEHIEVPLASALMEGLAYNAMRVTPYPDRYKSPREREITRRRTVGLPCDMSYADLQAFLDPFYRSYVCGDGRPLYVVCASHRTHVRRLLASLGLEAELAAAGVPELDDWYLAKAEWPSGIEGSLGLYPTPQPWADLIAAQMAERFRHRTAEEWEAILGAAGIPAAAHRRTAEWLHSAHPVQSGLLIDLPDEKHGKVRQFGAAAWLHHTSAFVAGGASAPAAARREQQAPSVSPSRPFFDGIRILDLTNVIAGPTISALLARFGAEVIKLDPVRTNFDPWTNIVFGMQGNQGKRSLLVDLKSADGQDILHRLLTQTDIVTVNASERQLADLHLTEAEIAAINPRTILCRIDAFGGPLRGPRSDYPGYDDLVQASTGIMARFGGGLETPEEHAHVGTIDVLCGFLGALAATIALVHRQRTGRAAVARTSLAAAGQLIQAPFMYDYFGRPPHDEPSGRMVKGSGPLYRCYEAADGWFFLAAKLAQATQLQRIADIDGLEAHFRAAPVQHWLDLLGGMDIAAVAVGSLGAWRERLGGAEDTFRFHRHDDHPGGSIVELVAPCAIRLTEAPLKALTHAEKFGASSRTILAKLGFDDATISAMLERGAVSESWSRQYLPD